MSAARDENRRQRQLDEARKAGKVPAATDEDGKEINPHIPQYIMKTPWYFEISGPTLKHQKTLVKKAEPAPINAWPEKGVVGPAATKYRKGACTNCGAMSHKTKDCLERPRKLGAAITGKDIKPDEIVQEEIDLDYDGKHDRWNGYDPKMQDLIFAKYESIEKLRRERQEDGDDGFKAAEENEQLHQKRDEKNFTVRNLRIREDTAKFLYNLDLNSAYYDPKARSMRSNPNPNAKPGEESYFGDNFVRETGSVLEHEEMMLYSIQANANIQAAPSALEYSYREYKERKAKLENERKNELINQYGDGGVLMQEEALPKPVESVQYTEYDMTGKLKNKASTKTVVRSKWPEDNFPGNHKSVFGSWWSAGKWGYACCHNTARDCYCTGAAGIRAELANRERIREMLNAENIEKSLAESVNTIPIAQREAERKLREDEEKKKKLERAMKEVEETEKERIRLEKLASEGKLLEDERKRKYHSLSASSEISEEQMEAYRLKRLRSEDPMAQMKDTLDDDL